MDINVRKARIEDANDLSELILLELIPTLKRCKIRF